MKQKGLPFLLFLFFIGFSNSETFSQEEPNYSNFISPSGNTSAAIRTVNSSTNYFTGIPQISIPIFKYTDQNGLKLNLSLEYSGGGVKVNETPSPAGVGWYLNTGGVITRTVRGMPDDFVERGFLYSPVIPGNYRPDGSKYYHDSIDAQQDVFQFNVNGRTGKFFIGKNKEIITVPLSKLRITYVTDPTITTGSNITSFSIIFEDGTKYVFSDNESSIFEPETFNFNSGYASSLYTTSWNLSKIISPFSSDTIKFHYTPKQLTSLNAFPETVLAKGLTGNLNVLFNPVAFVSSTYSKIHSIDLPNKKVVKFIYSPYYRYDGKDSALDKILICDSVFRLGYRFDWSCCNGQYYQNRRLYLNGLIPFTALESGKGYHFNYYDPLFPSYNSTTDISNSRDHWGFYNGATNSQTSIPSVPGIFAGANRTPSDSFAVASTLASVVDPTGGITYYKFQSNDVLQYNTNIEAISVNAFNTTQTNISLTQALNSRFTFNFSFDTLISRVGASPFSGTCNLSCYIKSLDKSVTYASTSVNLSQIFNVGSVPWTFNIANGNYILVTAISDGCSATLPQVNVNVTWQNQTVTGERTRIGGVRILQTSHFDPLMGKIDTISTYRYLRTDGKSSGFLGTVPKYDYPYKQIIVDNGTTSIQNYTSISSDPIDYVNFTQGSPVGYSRVEVIKGSEKNNIGKEVYEYTDVQYANSSVAMPVFPYVPTLQKDWALGLPTRISVYDNVGRLVKVTNNTYSTVSNLYSSPNFKSLKLGKISTTFYGDPSDPITPKVEDYIGQEYYPESGRSDLTKVTDTLYNSDGTILTDEKYFEYDSLFNLDKITSSFDVNKNLRLEKRFYYPYNYTIDGTIKILRDSGIINTVVSTEDWITGDATQRMLSSNISDFQQWNKGRIKPSVMYSLQSNAPLLENVIGTFNPAALVRSGLYIKPQVKFVAYDTSGNLLEVQSVETGVSNSVIMDYDNQLPVCKVSNATYNDIAYTSFESNGKGNWNIANYIKDASSAITGKYCYNLANGSIDKIGLSTNKKYLLSYWSKDGGSVVVSGGQNDDLLAQQNGWSLHTLLVNSVSSVTISGTGLIDELRLYPQDADMTTSTYEPTVGVTSTCDQNNIISYYFYDSQNRLKVIKDKDLNVVKKIDYGDSTLPITFNSNWQPTGVKRCEDSLSHMEDREERDINPYSNTFMLNRWVFDNNNCTTCNPPACGSSPSVKSINCVCETGIRHNISTVREKVYNPETGLYDTWKWKCTYYFTWSDSSVSSQFNEYNDTACTVELQ